MSDPTAEARDVPPDAPPPEAPSPDTSAPVPVTPAPTLSSVTLPARVIVRVGGMTDVGRIREHNEDNYLVANLSARTRGIDPMGAVYNVGERGLLFAVCDGMGGAAAGEIASQMAVDVIHGIVQDGEEPRSSDQFAQRLVGSIQEAGARIFLAAKSNRAQRGMGTTSTVAGVFGATLYVGQVGDSRAYLLRNGKLKQVTKDQSLVSKLIEAGQLSEAEAETYEHAHIILQALGTADVVSVDLSHVELRKDDVVMLCSDGLSGLATFEQIREALASVEDPTACCQRLVDVANEAGGHDNVTVIVARFEGDLADATSDDDIVGYQPYVLLEPVDAVIGGHVAAAFKAPDLPPPGSDVKHSLSIPPEAAVGLDDRRNSRTRNTETTDENEGSGEVVDERRNILGWFLVAAALVALCVAAWLVFRSGETHESPPPVPAPNAAPETRTGEAPVAPTPVNPNADPSGAPVTPITVSSDAAVGEPNR
jgi:serine/threonine protein phosphatase PrpC